MENYCAGGLLEKERTKFTRFQRVVSLVRSPSPPVILPRPFVMTEFCFSESAAGIGAGWGFSGLCVRVFALRQGYAQTEEKKNCAKKHTILRRTYTPGDENVCGVIRPVFDLILRPTPAQKKGCWPAFRYRAQARRRPGVMM